jgi:hypothetical protein
MDTGTPDDQHAGTVSSQETQACGCPSRDADAISQVVASSKAITMGAIAILNARTARRSRLR